MPAVSPWCSGQWSSSMPISTTARLAASGSMVLMVPTLAPASKTSLPGTSPEPARKLMTMVCIGLAAVMRTANTTTTAKPMATMTPVMRLRLFMSWSVHPQRAFGLGVEELLDELVGRVLDLRFGAEVAHLPLVEDAD